MEASNDRQVWVWILLASLSLTSAYYVDDINDYDRSLYFSCEGQHTLRRISSYHSNHHEDRVWSMGCSPTTDTIQNCHWTGYVNAFDEPCVFECPGNGFINGVESFHNNHHEDRRWAFKCCELEGRTRRRCRNTGFVNNYDGFLSYATPYPNQHFHGWFSIHDNHHEDRIYSFQTCFYE